MKVTLDPQQVPARAELLLAAGFGLKIVITPHDMTRLHALPRASPATLGDSQKSGLVSCPLSVSCPAPRPETSGS